MKIDNYVKFTLTMIAGCLLWLCIENAWHPPVVSAQQLPNGASVYIAGVIYDGKPRPIGGLDGLFGIPVAITAPLTSQTSAATVRTSK